MAVQHSLPIWAKTGTNNISPPSDMIDDGFKPTTVGDNGWLNYIFNQLTTHCQMPVGVVLESMSPSYPGALLCDGSTIGSPSSGATHSGDIYQALFIVLWNNFTVLPSKGASALDDWAANKTVQIPNYEGKALVGKSTTGEFAVPVGTDLGVEALILTVDQLPNEAPVITDPGHVHTRTWDEVGFKRSGASDSIASATFDVADHTSQVTSDTATTGITIDPFWPGGATPHINIQPSTVTNFFIKY